MKQRVEEMEREAMKLRELQAAAESADSNSGREGSAGAPMEGEDDKAQADSRSIYVGNVCSVYLHYLTYVSSHTKDARSTMQPRRKTFRPTFKQLVLSIG